VNELLFELKDDLWTRHQVLFYALHGENTSSYSEVNIGTETQQNKSSRYDMKKSIRSLNKSVNNSAGMVPWSAYGASMENAILVKSVRGGPTGSPRMIDVHSVLRGQVK
jgi:hypothetical protein